MDRRRQSCCRDVFIKAWRRLDTFRGDSAFASWLHRLAVNTMLENARSEGRRTARVLPMEDTSRLAGAARTSGIELKMDMESAIASLPRGARLAFVAARCPRLSASGDRRAVERYGWNGEGAAASGAQTIEGETASLEMTHEVIKHLLDDYVTGDLTEEARPSVEEHVAACALCNAEVESLKQILARAAELPKSIDPPADAWSNIRSAIGRDESAVRANIPVSRSGIWQRRYVLAAAAILVAVLSSAGTALYMKGHYSGARSSGEVANNSSAEATPATLAAFTLEENNYLRTASMLQDLLDQQEASLAPETVAQLKASLRTIDEAILEARNALRRDPANKMLIEMLSASYRQKVDLLRRTTELTRGT